VPIADQRRELRVFVALQLAVGIVLHERGVAGVEVLAGAQVAGQVRGRGAERIVAGIEAAGGSIERDAERGVIGAAPIELRPVAGGEWNPVAGVDAAARDFAGPRGHARVVLRALPALLPESVRFARQGV